MKMLNVAGNLDWPTWLRGLIGAGISSFGGAISGGGGPAVVDPADFNLAHPGKLIATTLIGAGLAAFVSMGKFLNGQPLPLTKQVTTTVQTVEAGPPKSVTTVTETHTEPLAKKEV